MSMLDFTAFDKAPLQHDPCDFLFVPSFLNAEALQQVNRDYPEIEEPGNFEPDKLAFGPAFAALLEELNGPVLKKKFEEKFGVDLSKNPLQITVRKYAEKSDGNIHNDSKGKILTTLIYFNDEWDQEGGRLRILRSPKSIDNYAAEVAPEAGNLIAFKRSDRSYHGFKRVEGERRSLQMYWVKPKRAARGEKTRSELLRKVKRLLKRPATQP